MDIARVVMNRSSWNVKKITTLIRRRWSNLNMTKSCIVMTWQVRVAPMSKAPLAHPFQHMT